jgi:single stranded DNA-binding protein
VATNRSYKDANGEWQSVGEFNPCIAWGNVATTLANLCKKGSYVLVEGRLQTSSWETDAGEKRYRTQVNASKIIVLEKKKAENDPDEMPPEGMDEGTPVKPGSSVKRYTPRKQNTYKAATLAEAEENIEKRAARPPSEEFSIEDVPF